jgi:hypothetical protein
MSRYTPTTAETTMTLLATFYILSLASICGMGLRR